MKRTEALERQIERIAWTAGRRDIVAPLRKEVLPPVQRVTPSELEAGQRYRRSLAERRIAAVLLWTAVVLAGFVVAVMR